MAFCLLHLLRGWAKWQHLLEDQAGRLDAPPVLQGGELGRRLGGLGLGRLLLRCVNRMRSAGEKSTGHDFDRVQLLQRRRVVRRAVVNKISTLAIGRQTSEQRASSLRVAILLAARSLLPVAFACLALGFFFPISSSSSEKSSSLTAARLGIVSRCLWGA